MIIHNMSVGIDVALKLTTKLTPHGSHLETPPSITDCRWKMWFRCSPPWPRLRTAAYVRIFQISTLNADHQSQPEQMVLGESRYNTPMSRGVKTPDRNPPSTSRGTREPSRPAFYDPQPASSHVFGWLGAIARLPSRGSQTVSC